MKKKLSIGANVLINLLGLDRALEIIAESGFDGIDYALGQRHQSNDVDAEYLLKVKEKAQALGLAIAQTHGYLGKGFWEQQNQELFRTVCERDLHATALLGAPACIIHPVTEQPFGSYPLDPELLHKVNLDGYSSLVPFAEKYGVELTLESFGRNRRTGALFFASPYELVKSYEAIPTQMKSICLDTGHTHEAGEFGVPPVEEFIRIVGNRIKYLHLHDNFGYYDAHALPGYGNINWVEVFHALDEIGFDGYYNFEISYDKMGCMCEDYMRFCGKYLRKFVELGGNMSTASM